MIDNLFSISLFLLQVVMTSTSNGGLLADLSKRCPDKPSVKYVDSIFVELSEKCIFYAFQLKFENPSSNFFLKLFKL